VESVTVQPEPGSVPLDRPADEAYARARGIFNMKIVEAGAAAGFSERSGAASKLERKPHIKARIQWWRTQDADRLKAKRDDLEAFWWTALHTDPAVFFEVREEPLLTKKGERVIGEDGKPMMRKVQRLKNLDDLPFQARRMVEGVTYTETGRMNLKTVSKAEANKELRKMLGGDKQPETLGASFIELIMESYRIAEEREQQAKASS